VLLNGRRYEGVPGMADYQIDNFQSYAIRVEPYETKATQPSTKIKSTIELTREDSLENFAELQWRVSLPISALLLVLLALPLSFFNPRAGRTMHFLLAILIYLTYENFLGVSQSWIAKGVIHPYVGLWWVHGVIMILAGFLFYRRMVKI
jgi:lipopolysaccharide export system permease protein